MADNYTLTPTQSERIDIADVTTQYPSNNDGEPLCTGKEDGQCTRTVDEPGGVCWQHED